MFKNKKLQEINTIRIFELEKIVSELYNDYLERKTKEIIKQLNKKYKSNIKIEYIKPTKYTTIEPYYLIKIYNKEIKCFPNLKEVYYYLLNSEKDICYETKKIEIERS